MQGELKLIDFGLACKIENGKDFVKRDFVGGTKDFLSPEVYSAYVIEDGVFDKQAMREKEVVDYEGQQFFLKNSLKVIFHFRELHQIIVTYSAFALQRSRYIQTTSLLQ